MSEAPSPIREAALFMAIALVLAVSVALVFPKFSELAPLVSIPIPLISTALVIAFSLPRERRGRAWADVGLSRLGLRGMVPAVALPVAIAIASFVAAAALG